MKKSHLAIVITVILIVGIGAALFYNFLIFRVTKTTPEANNFPSITPYIDIYLSKDVKEVKKSTLDGAEFYGTVSTEGNRVRVTLSNPYSTSKTYSLKLSGITSKSGDSIDYVYTFTPVYMDYNKVPEDVRKNAVSKSSSGQTNDPFLSSYFPIQEDGYQIEYRHSSDSEDQVLYVTLLGEVMDYDTNTKRTITDGEAEEIRNKVLQYIKDHKGNPDAYHIYYNNEYLNNKYTSQYAHDH